VCQLSVKQFNWGWKGWEISQYVQEVLKPLFSQLPDNTVVINSTWYTDETHLKVTAYLDSNPVDRIIIYSFVDASIADHLRFSDRNIPVYEIGYYRSLGFFDFWAKVVQEKYTALPLETLLDPTTITKPFLSYNRKPHEHRKMLYSELLQHDLLDLGIVTFDSERQLPEDVAGYIHSAPTIGSDIPNDILSLGRSDIWCSSLINIVTETWWDINRANFVSEKIYKPIVGYRPFVVYAKDGARKWLLDRGFKTYNDEFKQISEYDPSDPGQLVAFLDDLVRLSVAQLQELFVAFKPKLIYNKNRFDEYAQEQTIDKITNEILKD
jgi:hypothetical protein